MKILYNIPSKKSIYALRTIYNGYKNAFIDLGHSFKELTAADDDHKLIFERYNPDILITSLSPYHLKFLNLDLIKQYRKKGLKVFVNIPLWNTPHNSLNENTSLSKNIDYINLIKSGDFGDVYYNICEQDDYRMQGFEKECHIKYHTIPLAADKRLNFYDHDKKYKAEISFIGTNLPHKRQSFKKYLFPLKNNYDLKLYGQDWTLKDKTLGWCQRFGQYFNIKFLESIQKPKLPLDAERKIYSSSVISINIHEDHQKKYGGDCNERTFKVPLCQGFEITDNVKCIKKYFKEGEEIIIAENEKDWFEKIDFYLKNTEKRTQIIEAGRERVLKDHTYNNRVEQIIRIYNSL